MSSTAQFSWDEMVLLDDLVSSGEVKLGRGNVISKIDIRNNPGTYPIYSSSSKNQGKMGEYGSFMFDEELISWSVDGGGYVFYRPKHKFSVTNVSGYMKLVGEWDYKFVAYVLQFQHEYFSFDYQTKAHPSVIREFYLFPRIPLHEQQKIAAILSSVDDVIEKTRAQIDKLKDLKTGMMQELLTKGIGHTAFKDSPVGRIPEEWDVVELARIARVIDCKHATPKYFSEGYPVVKPGNIKEGNIDIAGCSLTDKDGFDDLNENHKPRKGDTVYSRNQTYGIGAFVHKDLDFAIGQDVCVIHPTDCEPKFIFYAVNAPVVRDQVELLAAGSTFKRINLGSIRNLLVPVPAREEQKRISLILSSVDRNLLLIEQRLSCVTDIKKALMQDLLTGKVRVNVDNKENAVA
ncbi:MAG: restriction endonuclease subunit S [Alcanivorax sediminis]|uniref:restriction endonuclease subunit S n=1 Tax=Alcanivorax sediminis TaxID=2663008 RepID=UPI003C4FAA79